MTVARQWSRTYGDTATWDELESGAMMLAIGCLRAWNPEKGAFSTYLYRAAQNPGRYVITAVEYRRDGMNHARMDWYWHIERDEEDEKQDWMGSGEDVEEHVLMEVLSCQLRNAIERLPKELHQHARDTLNGTVCWKDLEATVKARRHMLELLREDLLWHPEPASAEE